MKTSQLIIAATPLLLMAAACSNDNDVLPLTSNNLIRIEAKHPGATRVNDTGFDNGDQIGLYVVENTATLQPGGNMVNNGCFEYDGSAWTSARAYYWDEGTYNVYAYHPYMKGITDTENCSFTLPSDQSTAEGYSAADFLWASASDCSAGENPVQLQFSHSLSNVIVNVEKADDYEGELPENLDVYIHSTYTTASIDLRTGGAMADSQKGFGTIKAMKLGNNSFSAIVVPQRIDSRRPLVEVVCGNISYMMEGTISFRQGISHTVTLKLSKSPEQLEIEIGGGIGPWE